MRVLRSMVVMGAVATALIGAGIGTAQADPPSTPALTSVVGVGSDTTTPLFNQLTSDYNVGKTAATSFWSWDATGSSPIITKASGSETTCSITRPNGSGAGITALNATATDGGSPCIDYARSSRKPNAGTTDTFIVLANDAISWTSPKAVSPQVQPEPTSLTVAQLTLIYNCDPTARVWNAAAIGGHNSDPIVPVLPQSGSGTRNTFLAALGITTPGSCVVNGTNSSGAIEENTGVGTANVAQFNPGGVAAVDDIYPYSVGDWIAQGTATVGTTPIVGGHSTAAFAQGNLLAPQQVSGVNPITTNVATPPNAYPKINNAAFTSALQRTLYDVAKNTNPTGTPGIATNLQPIFDGASATPSGWICKSGSNDIISFGFLVSRTCGAFTAGT